MTNDLERFKDLLDQLDAEGRILINLMARALVRKDIKLNAALEAYGHIPRANCDDASCEIDFDLIGRIKSVCCDDESLNWGRALTSCVLRGDERKAAALQDIMRRRVAS